MNRQTRFIVTTILLAAFVLFLIAQLLSGNTATTKPSTISYTNAISGQRATDIIGEAPNQQSDGFRLPPTIAISGIDTVFGGELTGEQAGNAYLKIKSFLFARSGLNVVYAGVVNGTVTQSANQVQFTLMVQRPHAKYIVTVHVANQYQTIPDVTFKEAS